MPGGLFVGAEIFAGVQSIQFAEQFTVATRMKSQAGSARMFSLGIGQEGSDVLRWMRRDVTGGSGILRPVRETSERRRTPGLSARQPGVGTRSAAGYFLDCSLGAQYSASWSLLRHREYRLSATTGSRRALPPSCTPCWFWLRECCWPRPSWDLPRVGACCNANRGRAWLPSSWR